MNKDILSTTTRPFLLVFSFFLWIQNVQALPTVGTLTAAGGAFNFDLYNGDGPPLLVQSTNGGVSWAIVTIPNLPGSIFPDYGFFHTTSCNGSFCLAAGETDNDLTDGGVGTAIPLLVSTKNSGNTWEVVLDLPLQPNGTFEASSCAMNGINASTSTCVIVGYGTAGTGDFPADPPIPQLVISQNSGASWTVPTISGLPLSGDFHAVSCAKSGVCIAAGENDTNLTITPATQVTPLLVLSIDGGTTWETVTLNPSGPGIFNAASCSGDVVADTVCTVAGVSGTTTNPPTIPPTSPIPLLLTSINGGSSWNTITNIPNLPTLGSFSATSCTGSGIDAVCVAAGQNNSTSQPSPLLVKGWELGCVPKPYPMAIQWILLCHNLYWKRFECALYCGRTNPIRRHQWRPLPRDSNGQ
ncbi:MAG: hypothetical protein NTW94_01585 [Legionellales bacterium]|nr:hypothetical protein [Legionellales bacterium]